MGLRDLFKKKKKTKHNEVDKVINLFNMDIDDIWNLTDRNSFVIAMNAWIDRKCSGGTNFNKLTEEEQTIFVVDSFAREVNNGGFEQFLFNSSGAFYGLLLSSLKSVGADDIINIYQEVLKNFPDELPQDEDLRDEILYKVLNDELSIQLLECDKLFYNIEESIIEELEYNYIMKNKDNFR